MSTMTEQHQANLTKPRAMSEKGSPVWCWQTISALQTQWKSLNFDLDIYWETWADAEEYAVWQKVPYDDPFGTKDEMLRRLEIGDIPSARAKVAERAMEANLSSSLAETKHIARSKKSPSKADYLVARIARERPDIWERMKRGEFKSMADAARAAGLKVAVRKRTVTLSDNVERVADKLREHYTLAQRQRILERLGEEPSTSTL